MSETEIDRQIRVTFDYALGRESFVRDSVNFIWSNWGQISEETREYILDTLSKSIETWKTENVENDLFATFTNERVRYRGCLGNYETAGMWKGLYNLVSNPSPNRTSTRPHPRQILTAPTYQ